jgi:TonB family protein
MPQSSVQPGRVKKKRTGVLVGAAAMIVVGGLGGGLYYTAVRGGSLPFIGNPFGTTAEPADPESGEGQLAVTPQDSTADSTAAVPADTSQQLAANPDSAAQAQDTTPAQVTPPAQVEPEPDPEPPPPGRLVLAGLPEGAVVSVDGTARTGTNIALTQGNRRVMIRADGYEDYASEVRIRAGQRTNLTVTMQLISQCDILSGTYNADGSCFDRQPSPLAALLVPLTAEIQETPTTAMLGIKVNPDGSVAQVSIITPSDTPAFNILAVDFAQSIRYNPAQKDGQAVIGWTRQIFYPQSRL